MTKGLARWWIGVAAVLLAGALFLEARGPGPGPGPLQAQEGVLGWSFHVPAGSTFSFVVWISAAQPATVTLDRVSLRDPDPGLQLVGTGLLRAPLQEQYLPTFPPEGSRPVAGAVVATGPDDSSEPGRDRHSRQLERADSVRLGRLGRL